MSAILCCVRHKLDSQPEQHPLVLALVLPIVLHVLKQLRSSHPTNSEHSGNPSALLSSLLPRHHAPVTLLFNVMVLFHDIPETYINILSSRQTPDFSLASTVSVLL